VHVAGRTRVGKDFRGLSLCRLTDSGTGVEASLWGVLGVKLGWIEGVAVPIFPFLGLVTGLDLRHPGVKLPGFGAPSVIDDRHRPGSAGAHAK